jgi:sigma-B regulation protein RsbU (phosphoserine phosphatase)
MRSGRTPLEQELKDRALNSASEGFTIVDIRQPSGPLIYVNEGFERLTGYSAEEALGTNCSFLQGPDTDPQARDEISQALRERRECRLEILNYRKDGTPFWNRLSLTPVRNSANEVTHYIGVQSDVTDRRQAEEALRQANEELRVTSERMRRSLEAAAQIQRALLPEAAPEIPGVKFAWGFRPCDELAGDLLGIVPLADGCVGLFVIDVAGHGVPAALLSVTLSHWLARARARSPLLTHGASGSTVSPPARVAESLSAQFPLDVRTCQYFTMLYGVLDAERRIFRFVSAGHPSPVLLPRDHAPRLLWASGFPIGMIPDAKYDETEIALGPGDRLFLYSDGIAEARNSAGEEFGLQAFLDALHNSRAEPLDDALTSVLAEVESHARASGMKDDLTILGIEIL